MTWPCSTNIPAQFATAARLYRRALAVTTRALGPEHPDVATLYHNLGGLEHARGRYARRGAMGHAVPWLSVSGRSGPTTRQ